MNFNWVSALTISILLLNNFKNLNIFFKNKTSLGIDNDIIPGKNLSMSKNTESTDIAQVCSNIIHKLAQTYI